MKKVFAMLLAAITLVSLCACSTPMPAGFDEATAVPAAEAIVASISEYDFDSVYALFREDLKTQISKEQLQQALQPTLEEAGAFVKNKSVTTGGNTDTATGEAYAVIVVVSKYENASHTYTISFNKDLELVGLFMK